MQLMTIEVVDLKNPIEVNNWLSSNSSSVIFWISVQGYYFYIFYT